MKPYKAILIVIAVLFFDQFLKIWVKTHMMIDGNTVELNTWLHPHSLQGYYMDAPGEIIITKWFRIHFVENTGMAFSMELPGAWGPILLRIFRLIAAIAGIIYINGLFKKKAHWGLITSSCIILAGAIGNLIDGAFYGMLFTNSYRAIAHFTLHGAGYAGFMQGDVVDMLSFPIWHGIFPDWVPFLHGQFFEFFNAIFNISDAAIFIGVVLIVIFQKPFFKYPDGVQQQVHTTPLQTEENPSPDPQSSLS